jgi:hypothetical protein
VEVLGTAVLSLTVRVRSSSRRQNARKTCVVNRFTFEDSPIRAITVQCLQCQTSRPLWRQLPRQLHSRWLGAVSPMSTRPMCMTRLRSA